MVTALDRINNRLKTPDDITKETPPSLLTVLIRDVMIDEATRLQQVTQIARKYHPRVLQGL